MAKDLFTEDQIKYIEQSIGEAEMNTSGEIRVHIEKRCKEDVLDRASHVFSLLEMQKTELRNGVLFYLATEDKQFAILGDVGINKVVPKGFWDEIRDMMVDYFKKGEFTEGLVEGLKKSGEQLKAHFPYQKDDVDELPNEVSFGKK
jgi:uncharacterized membrane protein